MMRLAMLLLIGSMWPASAIAVEPELDRAAWSADLDALKDALSSRYANLEWAVERGMDLPALARRTQGRLDAATTEYEARLALERLVRSFGDGHLEISWPIRARATNSRPPTPAGLCETLGFGVVTDDYAVGPRLPGYQALDPATPAAAGTVMIDHRKVGIVRIERFAPSALECARALEKLKLSASSSCDEACAERVSAKSDQLFVQNIEDRLKRLAKAKPDLLLVDVTRNGGGDDSAIALARLFGGDLPSPEVARIRDIALAQNISDKREAIIKALMSSPKTDDPMLKRMAEDMARAEKAAGSHCDRKPLWAGKPIDCTGLVRGPFYAGGLAAKPPSGPFSEDVRDIVHSASRYRYSTGAWTGRLAVLVDGDTASSAELFTAMLQDSGRAIVIGSPSVGAGCGWMLPVRPVILPHSKGELRMPDCMRYRADGSNEVDAIKPDIAAFIRQYDTPKQKAQRVLAALSKAFKAGGLYSHRPSSGRLAR